MKKYIVYIVYTSLSFSYSEVVMCWIKYLWINQIKILFGINASEINGGVVGCYRFLIAQPNVEYLFPIAPI